MPKKRFSAEQIVTLLRQIEVLMPQGKSAPEACRDAGISQQNYAVKWRVPEEREAAEAQQRGSFSGAVV
jgi:hypothetical protein